MGSVLACGRDHGDHITDRLFASPEPCDYSGHGLSTEVGGIPSGVNMEDLTDVPPAAAVREEAKTFRWFSSNPEETAGLDSRVTVWSRVLLRLKFVLCCCSVAKVCETVCNPIVFDMPGSPVLYCLPSLLRFMSTESIMCSNHYILCRPLVILPSVFPSIRVFSNESRNSSSEPLFC